MQNFSSIYSRASVCVCVRLVNYPFKLLGFSSRGKRFAARGEAGVWALSLSQPHCPLHYYTGHTTPAVQALVTVIFRSTQIQPRTHSGMHK